MMKDNKKGVLTLNEIVNNTEDMEEYLSAVYVKIDEENRIIRCEGGYTTPEDLTGWVEIDRGTGDKYNLCQTHYFKGGLYGKWNTYKYKLAGGKPVERTEDEQKADYVEPVHVPTEQEKLRADVDYLSAMTGIAL